MMMCKTPLPAVGRAGHGRRGQALIMVVLLMFAMIALGGVFIAVISQAMTQVSRAEHRVALQSVLEAGLAFAQNELVSSPDGADWTPPAGPDTANPGWVRNGDGFYRISLSYGPTSEITASNPFLGDADRQTLDRNLQITVHARLTLEHPTDVDPNDPEYEAYRDGSTRGTSFLRSTVTAYMRTPLTDYLRWITNIDGTSEPVTLGSTLELRNPNGTDGMPTITADPDDVADPTTYDTMPTVVQPLPYLAVFNGPIRSEVDMRMGNARIDLTHDEKVFDVQRYDTLEVAGRMLPYTSTSSAYVMVNYKNVAMGSMANAQQVNLKNPIPADSASYVKTLETDPLIRPLRAPRLDARHPVTGMDRYRALTLGTAMASTDTLLGTVSYREGAGLYINNRAQIQHNGDLAALRREWLTPNATNSTWTSESYYRKYDPVAKSVATVIELGDWETPATASPKITLRTGNDEVKIPYPKNGVIFAEGNVVVKGNLPASTQYVWDVTHLKFVVAATPAIGGNSSSGVQYFVEDDSLKAPGDIVDGDTINRRFDLTIVSGGTIYIEGSVLSPSSRDNTISPGSPHDSKLALLAMDHVCLNPTKLYDDDDSGAGSFREAVNTPFTVSFASAGEFTEKSRLLLRHAGTKAANDDEYVLMKMDVNGASYPWQIGPPIINELLFTNNIIAHPGYIYGGGLIQPPLTVPAPFGNVWPLTASILNPFNKRNEFTFSRGVDGTPGGKYLQSVAEGTDGAIGSGFMVTRLDLQVDALIYAQRGSWFVIPGRFYNEKDTTTKLWGNDATGNQYIWPFPGYQEPQDVRIVINGAISENRPAPADEERAWLARWRGSNLDYFDENDAAGDPGPDGVPDRWDPGTAATTWDATTWRWTNRRMGIEYHYDATLMLPVRYTLDPNDSEKRHYQPRLPKMPVSPSLVGYSRTL